MKMLKMFTKKASASQCYCAYYLKDKELMELLGVEHNNNIEDEIIDYRFSLLIDTLGEYETFMKNNGFTSIKQLQDFVDKKEAEKNERG